MAVEEVVVPQPGTPEYETAMIAKAEGALNPPEADPVVTPEADPEATPGTSGERPQWLPEKFNTPEDLAKAYAELEKKQGAPAEEKPEATPETPEGDAQSEAEKAVEKAGLDYETLTAEFREKGQLSDESYAALAEKAGLSREYVDSFIAGQQALAREAQTRAFDIAGGESEYATMTAWAAANLSLEDIQAYNSAIEGTAEAAALAVMGLKAKYAKANGSEPALVTGGAGTVVASSGYASTAEMTAAMKDPRYQKDPAYRRSVEQRIANSKIF